MIYLLNSLIIPADLSKQTSVWVRMRKANIDEVRQLLSQGFTSAIGHESTSILLTELLGVKVPFNRIAVSVKPGDIIVHFVLKTRLPEGKVLDLQELQNLEYYFVVSEIVGEESPPQRGVLRGSPPTTPPSGVLGGRPTGLRGRPPSLPESMRPPEGGPEPFGAPPLGGWPSRTRPDARPASRFLSPGETG
jgi:hypothetical protein